MEAITREEKIISGENLTPITRKEMFLAKAAGQDVATPKPITREEMFLSKIVGGSGGGASAYAVSSVDELPSDAVDGSMAIVELKTEYGVYFNENITIPSTFWDSAININFVGTDSAGDHYLFNEMYFWSDGEGISFYGEISTIEEAYINGDGWLIPSRIEFPYNAFPSNDDFVNWCRENGSIFRSDDIRTYKYFYIHENGEWVYKCEVA